MIRYLIRIIPAVPITLLLIQTNAAYAQTCSLSGRITDDADGKGLPGVNFLLKGSSVGTTTNAEGNS